jgi:hypothetical protein
VLLHPYSATSRDTDDLGAWSLLAADASVHVGPRPSVQRREDHADEEHRPHGHLEGDCDVRVKAYASM